MEEFLDESDPQSTKKEAEVKIKPTAAVTAPSSVVILQGKAPVLLKPGMASKLQSASQRKAAEQKIEASSEIESRKNTTNEISVSYVQGSNSQNSVVDSRGSGEISSISARKQRPISSFIGFSSNSVKTNSAPISIIHSAHSPIFGQANRDSSENLALYKTEDEESNLTEVSLKEKLANRATFDFDNIPLSLKNRPKQNTSVREIFESLQLEIGNQDDEEDEFISREIIDNEDEDEDESILGSTFVSRKPTVQPVKTNFSRVVTMVSQKPTYKQQVMEAEQIKSPKMDNYKTISTYVHAFDPSIYEQERFSRDYDDDDEIAVAKPMESFSTQDLVSAMPGSAVRSTPISALKVEMGPSKAINMAANLPVRKEIVITDVSPNKQVSMGKTVSEAFITNKKTGTSPSVSLSVSLQNDRVIKPVVANLPAISGGMMAQPVSNNDFIKAKITMPGVKDDKIFEKKLDVSDLDDLDGLLGEMNEF